MTIFLIAFLLILAFLERTVTTVPFVLIYLLCLTILKKDAFVFILAFFAGLLLDVLAARTLGESSLFFTVFVFLILLYQRKYEINSYPFVAFAGFIGSGIFLLMFGLTNWIWQAIFSAAFAMLLFALLRVPLLRKQESII